MGNQCNCLTSNEKNNSILSVPGNESNGVEETKPHGETYQLNFEKKNTHTPRGGNNPINPSQSIFKQPYPNSKKSSNSRLHK
jgi:hypothetical protein